MGLFTPFKGESTTLSTVKGMQVSMEMPDGGYRSFFILTLLAAVIGAGAAFWTFLLRISIAFFHNLFFLGQLSFFYDVRVHTPPSPLGPLVVLVPVLGAIGVILVTRRYTEEVVGTGVQQVIEAIHHEKGVIPAIVIIIKTLAAALTIGSGGSVGREGPSLHINAAFAYSVSRGLRLKVSDRLILIAAACAGGLAATFNAPIAGMIFAVELFLVEFRLRSILPLVVASITAFIATNRIFGASVDLAIPLVFPSVEAFSPVAISAIVLFGVLMGVSSAVITWFIPVTEIRLLRLFPQTPFLRHVLGMLVIGILMYLMLQVYGQYYINGLGYATIQDILSGALTILPLLLLLFLLKLVATALTLGSGATGGVFAPLVFMGATMGGAYGIAAAEILPGLGIGAPAFAVMGMAGIFGGSSGALLTAVVIVLEITGGNILGILPLLLVVGISYGVRKLLIRDSIYTYLLTIQNRPVPDSVYARLIGQWRG
jgi:CIC family chloride channel protein